MCLWAEDMYQWLFLYIYIFGWVFFKFFICPVSFQNRSSCVCLCINCGATSRYHRQNAQKARILTVILCSDSTELMVREQHHQIHFGPEKKAKTKRKKIQKKKKKQFHIFEQIDFLTFFLSLWLEFVCECMCAKVANSLIITMW